ncbi:conserved hypothetical protein [Candidatus Magnetomoraceae bacterium gMMP-13]
MDIMIKWFIFILLPLSIIGLLYIARLSQQDAFTKSVDKDEVAQLSMKQSLGLPMGTVRAILAIVVTLAFFGTAFLLPEGVPDSVKIVTSLVFGYYFGKKDGDTKEVMKAMLGASPQRSLRQKEAALAITEAERLDAEKYAYDLLNSAKNFMQRGDSADGASDAISAYQNAIEKAHDAKVEALQSEKSNHENLVRQNDKKFNELFEKTGERIDELKELEIEQHITVEKLREEARDMAHQNKLDDALKIMELAESKIDVLLEDSDKAKELCRTHLSSEQIKELQKAKENLDKSEVIASDGMTMIRTILSIIGTMKDNDKHNIMVSLLKKRISADPFNPLELKKIYKDLKESGNLKYIENITDIAANAVGEKFPDTLRREIKELKLYEKVIIGNDDQIENLYRDYFVHAMDIDEFDIFVQKIRNKLVDLVIEDSVKKCLPNNLPFEKYRESIKNSQNDKDGWGTLLSIQQVMDIGEKILGRIPLGNAAKSADIIARGILK